MAKKAISLEDIESGSMTAEELNQGVPEQEAPPAEPVEQPVEETSNEVEQPQVEEPKAPTEEPKVEEKVEEAKPPEQFNFEFFNKQIGKNYESLDQVKADLEKPTMESEYEQVKTQLEEWQAKYNDLNESFDVLSQQMDPRELLGDDDLKIAAFKKANPSKDAAIAQKVFSEDLTSIDDLDMVKMGWKFNTPKLKGTDRDLEVTIAEELGQDPDTPVSEWPVSAQNRLARMAAEYSDQFKTLKSSITLPEKVNIEELKAQRKQAEEERLASLTDGWGKIAQEALESTKSVKLPVGVPKEGEEQQFFEWELSEPPKKEVEDLKERFIGFGLDPNEHKEVFRASLEQTQIQKNLPMMLQKYGEDLLAKQEETHLEDTHNPNPLKDSQRSEDTSEDKDVRERSAFALGGLGSSLHGNPLFKVNK
jgi:hypothetical protein